MAETDTQRAGVMSNPAVQVWLLGEFRISISGQRMAASAWRRRAARQLFKCVLASTNRRILKETAIESLWPESGPTAGDSSFRAALSVLRQALAPLDILATDDGSLAIRPGADIWIDVDAFQKALANARTARDPLPLLEEANALYRGDFLAEDLYEDWAAAPRETLKREWTNLQLILTRAYEQRDDPDRAAAPMERLLRADPANEQAACELMQLFDRQNRRSDALRVFQNLERVLRKDFGVEPSSSTLNARDRILAGQESEPPIEEDSAVHTLPTGTLTYLFTDVEASRHQPKAWSPGSEQRMHNLTPQLSSFVGRRAEVAELLRVLATSRLLTLTGPGGVGKTRLALVVSEAALSAYEGGVWLVELGWLDDPRLLVPTVAATFGLRESRGPLLRQLADQLCTKATLIVLDNCEHLLESCGEFVDALLRACPTVRVICTSRERLNIAGEVVWGVAGLSAGASPGAGDERHEEAEAVDLFVERAKAVHSGFRVTENNRRAIAEICSRLDGLPLAIELAAARVNVLTPQQIGDRLAERFDLLIGGRRNAPERHQTLRATLAWSYDLLTSDEQRIFKRTSVFSGGFALDAVDAVCNWSRSTADSALDLLARLVDKSLIVAEEHDDEIRYRLLESVHVYGRQRLSETTEESAEVDRRHTAYFVDLAERAESQMRGPDKPRLLDRLQREQDNLRAALRRSLDSSDVQSVLRLASALWYFWRERGHIAEGSQWLERALQQPQLEETPLVAKTLRAAGALDGAAGKLGLARTRFGRALAIYERVGDQAGIARALNNLAVIATELAEYAEAEEVLNRCLLLSSESDDSQLAVVMGNLAWLAEAQGDFSKALDWHRQAHEIWRTVDDPEGMATSLIWQAAVLQSLGDLHTAEKLAEEGLDLSRSLAAGPAIIRGLRTLGTIYFRTERLAPAAALLRDSLRLAMAQGLEREAAASLTHLADLATRSNLYVRAAHMLAMSDELQRRGGWVRHLEENRRYEDCVAKARSCQSHESFAAVWSDGHRVAPELLLSEVDVLCCEIGTHTIQTDSSRPTAREIEMARDSVPDPAAVRPRH